MAAAPSKPFRWNRRRYYRAQHLLRHLQRIERYYQHPLPPLLKELEKLQRVNVWPRPYDPLTELTLSSRLASFKRRKTSGGSEEDDFPF